MKFGIRECCDVVLKAKATQTIGNKKFYKHEPVCYFDTLKTSTLEGAATTVYAQGGRGNPRLIAWEGERTVTFTMEDALISAEGLAILTGAGLIDAAEITEGIIQHVIERTVVETVTGEGTTTPVIYLEKQPYVKDGEDLIYVMVVEGDDYKTEPYIGTYDADLNKEDGTGYAVIIDAIVKGTRAEAYAPTDVETDIKAGVTVVVDYYTARKTGAKQVEITADKFGGNYYLEASTLFRNTDGIDMPAEFIIPNCKVQSNFTFTMASSGDPSTFTFTMDAFPDYTRFDTKKKVLSVIQIIEDEEGDEDTIRLQTDADASKNS